MRRLIPSVLVAASLLVACQKADEHPPALDTTCPPENPNCHDLPPLGGGAIGYAYHRLVGCRSGACPITANPWVATAYGALMGLMLAR